METLDEYLDRLASDSPVPGGGSAGALSGTLGAALIAMVARIAGRSPRNAGAAEELAAIAARADDLRRQLADARADDEAAYAAVVAAQAMPKESLEEKANRRDQLAHALARAAEEPLRSAALHLEVLQLATRLLELPTNALSSDVGSAAELAAAALATAAYNVRVNHRYMHDAEVVELQEQALRERETAAQTHLEAVRAKLRGPAP